MKTRRLKRIRNRVFLSIMLVALGLGIFKGYGIIVATGVTPLQTLNTEELQLPDDFNTDWNLILVNRNNFIPSDYKVELIDLSNGHQVDARIYPSLQQMFDDARTQGVYPTVVSGYRTEEKQRQLMDEKIKAYEMEGNSKEEAAKLAEGWVAIPGTSEHQLGLAVDINADKVNSTNEQVYEWFSKNAHKYGFILRYPMEKTEITGIDYEPWHYRYVGDDAAKEMYEKGICLEEYLENE